MKYTLAALKARKEQIVKFMDQANTELREIDKDIKEIEEWQKKKK
jgi:hypothetical protein